MNETGAVVVWGGDQSLPTMVVVTAAAVGAWWLGGGVGCVCVTARDDALCGSGVSLDGTGESMGVNSETTGTTRTF